MQLLDRIKKAIPKLKHIRVDGSIGTDIARYCPECGSHRIKREVLPGVDFNEHGWFQYEQYSCLNNDCLHTWKEKAIIQGGGQTHYYGSNPHAHS